MVMFCGRHKWMTSKLYTYFLNISLKECNNAKTLYIKIKEMFQKILER